MTAIKSNIFGDNWWSVRMPTRKQAKQLKRQSIIEKRQARMIDPDPREAKAKLIVKHTTWGRK